jgi:hypothetical protein
MSAQALSLLGARSDHDNATERARNLLQEVISEKEWGEFEDRGTFKVMGKRGRYILSPYSRTGILDRETNRCIAYSCLQLTIPAPHYDRMVAEYLLIKNTEDTYWQTANIFSGDSNEFGIAVLCMIIFDATLFVTLLLELWALP